MHDRTNELIHRVNKEKKRSYVGSFFRKDRRSENQKKTAILPEINPETILHSLIYTYLKHPRTRKESLQILNSEKIACFLFITFSIL